ncbi:MAG: hypothetical protein PHC86_06465, partial [Eubacteriales bacterium]|nr:hypothetical protein [Eubacteriales bacterium]
MKTGDFVWGLLLICFTALLIIPETKAAFMLATANQPMLMGFGKFAFLASMGELLANRISIGKWQIKKGTFAKAIVWGFIGVLVTLMFTLYSSGVAGAIQAGFLPALPESAGIWATIWKAFMISTIMNLTFGPMFMAAHRISDLLIDSHVAGHPVRVAQAVTQIDWQNFIKFIVAKTVPFF